MSGAASLSGLPEWKALEAHYESVKDLHLRALFASDPGRAERFTVEAAGLFLDYSKNRITDETVRLLLDLAQRARRRGAARRDVLGREDQRQREPRRAACGAARRTRSDASSSTARTSCPRSTPCSTGWRPSPTRCAPAPGRGTRGKRIRNVVNIGIGGSYLGPEMAYRALRAFRDPDLDVSLRRQCRRRRLHQGDGGPRSARDAVHHRLEDLHDARDDDQRGRGPRWTLDAIGAEEGIARHFVALSTNAEAVAEIRHRHRQHVRLLGLGRRPLFDGFGDRPLDHDRGRAGQLPRDARRLPRHGRAFPHRAARAQHADADGAAHRLVQQFLRRGDGRRSCPIPPISARFPAYLQQLQMESNGKHVDLAGEPVDVSDRADHLGRAGHRRPAFVLPAHPSGDEADPLRLHRLLPALEPARRSARPPDGEPLRPGRGAGVRQDAPRSSRRKARRRRRRRSASAKATGRPTSSSPSG